MQTIRNVNIIVNAIVIVHAMLHLYAKEEINLLKLVMDAAIIIHADLISINMMQLRLNKIMKVFLLPRELVSI